MKNSDELQIIESLSANDINIINYLPYLLQDLSSLGSDQEVLLSILDRNVNRLKKTKNVLDLCCGKGASLISIVKKYKWKASGIDLFQPFINEAKEKAQKENLAEFIEFTVMDIREAVDVFSGYDLILFGSDTNILGNEITSLNKVSKCLAKNGFLLYQTAYKKYENFEELLETNGFVISDKIVHDPEKVKSMNTFNTSKIRKRAEELIENYPEQKSLFTDYIRAQENECIELESNYIFITYLLQPE